MHTASTTVLLPAFVIEENKFSCKVNRHKIFFSIKGSQMLRNFVNSRLTTPAPQKPYQISPIRAIFR